MGEDAGKERGFKTLLEQVRQEVATVADGVAGLHQKVDRVAEESAKRDGALDRKVDLFARTVNQKIEQVSNHIDERLASLGQQIQGHVERAHSN